MELKSLVCPHCGANTTNAQNCEYCGSMLVRFVDKSIDISNTTYLSDSYAFPDLFVELKKNLELQTRNPEIVATMILWVDETGSNRVMISSTGFEWADDSAIEIGDDDASLLILLEFPTYLDAEFSTTNKLIDEQLAKFRSLQSFPLFMSHTCSSENDGEDYISREYAIDFGNDADGATKLVSEILIKVFGLKPTDNYDIFTNMGEEVVQTQEAWKSAHEIKQSSNSGCAGMIIALISTFSASIYSLCLLIF